MVCTDELYFQCQVGGGGDADVQQRLETLEKLNEQLRRGKSNCLLTDLGFLV